MIVILKYLRGKRFNECWKFYMLTLSIFKNCLLLTGIEGSFFALLVKPHAHQAKIK